MKLFKRILQVLIILYCLIGIVIYSFQDKFLFHPVSLKADYQFRFRHKFSEYAIAMNNTDTISIIRWYPHGVHKGRLIYFHGNTGNVEYYYPAVEQLIDKGYEIWMPDYPGYGKSTGKLTEQKMYEQAEQVYKLAAINSDSLVIYGRSLGTAVASYVAANHNCKLLMLETPFTDMPDLFSSYAPVYPVNRMSKYQFSNENHLKGVRSKIITMHGPDDEVVPFANALKLKSILKPGDSFIVFPGAGHNNLSRSLKYRELVDSLL